jgi:hypothetical protein
MKIIKSEGQRMTTIDVQDYENILRDIIEGFVDDTSIFTNDITNDLLLLMKKLQEDGNKWNELLQASRGLL